MEWRETRDPYRIWVSEIMLQQTRVGTVAPYFRRFLESFPDVEALAAASPDAVMKSWEGLGYYARARNLHRAAKKVVREFGGRVPSTVEELSSLPGVGRSTAGAVAALAFGRDAPILDANAKRVIARLLAVEDDLSRPDAERRLWDASAGLILPGRGRETALALMDLGAMVCTPKRPDCPSCPVSPHCAAFQGGLQEAIPARRAKIDLPHHDVVAAWIPDGRGRVLVGRRPGRGLLGGLWELPGGRRIPRETLEEALCRELRLGWGMGVEVEGRIASVRHGFSHFRITLHAYRCRRTDGAPRTEKEWRWAAPNDLAGLPFPRAYRKVIEAVAGVAP